MDQRFNDRSLPEHFPDKHCPLTRIVSGGQTGVDRAALDVALEWGIPCGGWCPQGRRAEDGPISRRYPLRETPSPRYAVRTRWNVRDSDGTLILSLGPLTGGTALTKIAAEKRNKPCLVVRLDQAFDVRTVADWLRRHRIQVLNIAGPRASGQPDVHRQAADFLRTLMAALVDPSAI